MHGKDAATLLETPWTTKELKGGGTKFIMHACPPPLSGRIVRGTVESASQSVLRNRTTWTSPNSDEALPMQNNARKRRSKKTWDERLATLVIDAIVWCVPKRYNEMEGDVVDMTPWEASLRSRWLDRGLYKRKILAAAVIAMVIVCLFFGAGYVPWRRLFGMDSVAAFRDADGRVITNVLVPRMLEPKNNAGDRDLADWILSGDPFEPITPDIIKTGFLSAKTSATTRKNVSLSMLYEKMNSTAFEREFRCLCAVHMGIPANAILFAPVRKSPDNMIREVFMMEPSPTVGSSNILTTGPMTSNLQPGVTFTVLHPDRLVVQFLTTEGHRDKRELRGDDVACVIRCVVEIARKKKFVDSDTRVRTFGRNNGNSDL